MASKFGNDDGQRVEDFFASGDDFEEMLDEAEKSVSNSFSSDFCFDLRQKWEQYGMRGYMSAHKYSILRRMAGYGDDD